MDKKRRQFLTSVSAVTLLLLVVLFLGRDKHAQAEPTAAFLEAHWNNPHAGTLGKGWGKQEKTLLPDKCGACHTEQYKGWQGSRHAQAMSPGVLLQMLPEGNGQGCYSCHTPLAEQQPGQPGYKRKLREQGLVCAACHVRDGTVYGPPLKQPRPGETLNPAFPHNGFVTQAAFQESAFCAGCHQFEDDGFRMKGVLLENTYKEWQQSPAARQGQSCQSCHMPDRKHLWRGIHDLAMTELGVSVSLKKKSATAARYTIKNDGTGHYFPTYVTPRITVVVEALGPNGQLVKRETYAIQRRIDIYLSEQPFDTRLAPGDEVEVRIEWEKSREVTAVIGYLDVEPDEFYERFFKNYTASGAEQNRLLKEALKEIERNKYRAHQKSLQY